MKVAAIIFKGSSHVLACILRNGDPEAMMSKEQAIGDGLVISDPQSGAELFTVPQEYLEIQAVNLKEELALVWPWGFSAVKSNGEFVLSGVSPLAITNTDFTQPGKITLTIPGPSASRAVVRMLVRKADLSAPLQLKEATLEANATPRTITFEPFASGKHHVLVLVSGFGALVTTQNVLP
jgi:hypothetical protein